MKTLTQHTKKETTIDYRKGTRNLWAALLHKIDLYSVYVRPNFSWKPGKIAYLNIIVTAAMSFLVLSATQLAAQDVNIPDANFKSELVANTAINTNGDSEIQVTEALAFTGKIDVSYKSVADLTGIEAFENMTELDCGNNQLTSLALSSNTALTRLECHNNQLTSLDLSKNVALQYLTCRNNQLTALDLSKNTALQTIRVMFNQLTSLITKGASALTFMHCYDNPLTSLDVSENVNLEILYCQRSQLTSLIVGNNPVLKTIICNDNQLTSLDVSGASNLVDLICYSNELKSLDVSANTALLSLMCSDNQLTSLDVSKNEVLYNLECDDNQITSLNVSANTALTNLSCSENQLTSLDLQTNTILEELNCNHNQLTTLELSSNTVLEKLNCTFNQLTALDLSKNLALEHLNCSNAVGDSKDKSLSAGRVFGPSVTGNQISSLDLRVNTALRYLYCSAVQLTNLDLRNGNNDILRTLVADDNSLTCIVVDDVSADHSKWQKDSETTYCSGIPIAPSITSEEITTNESPFIVNIGFEEEVTGFDLTDLNVVNATVDNLQTSDNINFNLEVTPLEEGAVTINLAGHQVAYPSGDPNAPSSELSITYDNTSPTVLMLTSSSTQLPVLVTVMFSEEVTDFELDDLTLANCTVENLQTEDQKTFTLEATPLASGTLTIDLVAGKVLDHAGNQNETAPQFSINAEVVLGLTDGELAQITMFPNPTSDVIHIQAGSNQKESGGIAQIKLIDIKGQQILRDVGRWSGDDPISINITSFPPGVYLLQLIVHGRAITRKVIIQ